MVTQYQTGSSAETTTSLTWSEFFLHRLDHVTRLHGAPGRGYDADKLLRRGIYSTYVDCRELGVGAQARDLLLRNQGEAHLLGSGQD